MNRLKAFGGVFCATVSLAGCGVSPTQNEVEQSVSSSVADEVPKTPGAWIVAATSGQVQAGWIESFNDPLLTQLVIEAQQNNRDLAAAAANLERAQALARQAGAQLVPQIGLTGGGAESGIVDGSSASSFDLGAQVSWEVDVWGRIRSQQRGAEASAEAAAADLLAAQQSLAAATAKAYFSAIEAKIQVDIAQENVEILTESLRIADVKFRNGLSSAQDVALVRSDLATARERYTTLEGSHRDALRALEVLLGRYPAADVTTASILPGAPAMPSAGIPSELLERQPNLIAAERRVAAAFNATNQAKAARLPSITLSGGLGGASSELSSLLEPGNVAWSAGASLLAPLFDGGQRREAVEIATAEQQAALAAFGQAAISAFSEVESNLDQGAILESRLRDLTTAAEQSRRALRIAQLRYEEGEEELINLLGVQQRVNGSLSSLSSVRRLLLEQRVNLNLALGGAWE